MERIMQSDNERDNAENDDSKSKEDSGETDGSQNGQYTDGTEKKFFFVSFE